MASIAAAAGAPAHVVTTLRRATQPPKPKPKPTTLQELMARTAKRETPARVPEADIPTARYTKQMVDRASTVRGGLASTVKAEDKLG